MSAAAKGGGWQLQPIDAPEGAPQPDPYFDWAMLTRFAYYGSGVQWLPVLLELQGISAQAFAELVAKLQALEGPAQEFAPGLRVPPFFATPPRRLAKSTQFIGLLMQRSLLEAVRAGKEERLASMIRRFEVGRAMAIADPAAVMPPAPVAGGPPDVVVVVIDDGIGFAQERLLANDGTTRVEYFWDQYEPFGPFLTFGRELRKHDPGTGLDALMTAATHNGQVDEDELYRNAGFTDHSKPGHKPLAARWSHGAHVADLACFDQAAPAPGQRPVIVVQLPPQTVADTSGATLRLQVFLGIVYAMWRADAIAQAHGLPALPLLINVSYGLIAGPHDGTDLFEQALDTLLAACDPQFGRVEVLLPAGNSHLSRCHARFDLAAGGGDQVLNWRVLPDDLTESGVEIRLPPGADKVSLEITTPDGASSQPIGNGFVATLPIGNAWLARVNYPAVLPARRTMITLHIAPTASVDGTLAVVPAGLWKLTLKNQHATKPVPGVHAWVQRDDTAPGYARRGRQSFFDDSAYKRFDDGGRAIEEDPLTGGSCVRREGTLNALATGGQPVVVGAYRRSDGAAAPYSAGGKLPPPGRGAPSANGPDLMLPGDDTPSQRGVLGAGTRSGSCIAMNGTSVAAPLATRALSRLVVATPSPPQRGRKLLFSRAQAVESSPPPPPKPPKPTPKPQRGGGGRLDEPSNRKPRFDP